MVVGSQIGKILHLTGFHFYYKYLGNYLSSQDLIAVRAATICLDRNKSIYLNYLFIYSFITLFVCLFV